MPKRWVSPKRFHEKNAQFTIKALIQGEGGQFKKNASFDDMKKLIEFVETNVEKKTGIKLEKEIKILE